MNNKAQNFELDFIGNLYRLAFFLSTETKGDKADLMINNLEKENEKVSLKSNKARFSKILDKIKNSYALIDADRSKQLLAQYCLDSYNVLITKYTHAEFA